MSFVWTLAEQHEGRLKGVSYELLGRGRSLADKLDTLVAIKSKEEMVGEIIGLLQSPAKNVISGLKSGGGKLAGILKTLSEK